MSSRRLFEVWNFVRQYRDFLNIPANQELTFDKFVFFNKASEELLSVDRSTDPAASSRCYQPNVFRFLIQFLIMEEAKHTTTMRKLLRESNWSENIYNVIYYSSFVDECNFESFIRGFYHRSEYRIRKN